MWFIYSIISAFLASISSILEKKILEKEHSLVFSTALAIICAIILSPTILFYSTNNINLEAFLVIYLSSILGTIAFLEVTRGIRHLDISTSAPLFLLSPMITALLAFLFLGETISYIQIIGIITIGIGTYFLQTKELLDFKGFLREMEHNKYILYIIFGLFIYGITSILDKIIVSEYKISPIISVAWLQVFIAFNFLIIYFYKKINLDIIYNFFKKNFWLLIIISFTTIGYRVSQQIAISTAAAISIVIAIKRSSSLFTTIIGGEIFKEKDISKKVFACIIMILGVFLLAVK